MLTLFPRISNIEMKGSKGSTGEVGVDREVQVWLAGVASLHTGVGRK